MAQVKSVTKLSIDQDAVKLRRAFSRQLASGYMHRFDREGVARSIAGSLFGAEALDLHSDDPILVIGFSMELTKRTIEHVWDTVDDPVRAAFLASRLAELGGYSLFDPRTPTRQRQYLGASKRSGYFFTPPEIAIFMADRAIGERDHLRHALDPACGAGALLVGLLVQAYVLGVKIERLTAIELDPLTAELADSNLARLAQHLDSHAAIRVLNADALDVLGDASEFSGAVDCVVMNPPYGRIKFVKSVLTNDETKTGTLRRSKEDQAESWKEHYARVSHKARHIAASMNLGGGTLDYQRLFFGLALSTLAQDGRMAVISPNSWMGDHNSAALRRRLFDGRLIREVVVCPEALGLFPTVNQATAIAVLSAEGSGRDFSLKTVRASDMSEASSYRVTYESVGIMDRRRWRIPVLDSESHSIFEHLASRPRIGDADCVRNLRGELDLTLGAKYISADVTSHRLVRGDHIERFVLRDPKVSDRSGYVDRAFIEAHRKAPKHEDHLHPRIAGRQVSYLGKKRRLSFAMVPEEVVLGNSCNYLRVLPPFDGAGNHSLLVQLNSIVVEWFFRVFNSNNHVANYEIDDLPLIPFDSALTQDLALAGEMLTHEYSSMHFDSKFGLPIEDYADALVALGFDLLPDQLRCIAEAIAPDRANRIVGMLERLQSDGVPASLKSGSGWYQHSVPAMSEADLEMANHVPQGGNWTDIPTAVPSKRLEQIREMTRVRGGLVRTTYYGRLRPDQPAYTISTYFNRPGNGTNLTPWEDRVLTCREAARLQAFPDWYMFLGSDGSIRKQIGNAVPPLLGHAVGRAVSRQASSTICVDLFCGAGGLSLGLEMAGWNVVAALDNDEQALATYAFNRPCETTASASSDATLLLADDISRKAGHLAAADAIEQKLAGRRLGLLVGGPPCQGFSHAGWRLEQDERNDLAAVFMELVEALRPEAVVLENVEGILTSKKGAVVAALLQTMTELGYAVGKSPWRLSAECYGVPQMRRRVFLVGRQGEAIDPPTARLARCRGRREIGGPESFELDEAPYPVTAGEALWDVMKLGEVTHPATGDRHLRRAYADWLRGACSADELLDELS